MVRRHSKPLAGRLLFPLLAVLAAGCASTTPEWQRLRVEPGETEQVFETVALVVSRRFPIEKRDLATGVLESRPIEERRADGLYRWRATGLVRRDREGIVVAVSTVVQEFTEDEGFRTLGSVEEIDTAMLGEIEERLRAAASSPSAVKLTRLDPIESGGGDVGDRAIAGIAPPESRPPRQ